MTVVEAVADTQRVDKLGEHYASIMAEVCRLLDHSQRMLARAALPASKSTQRHLEAACLSVRRVCEYLAVAVVLAHHWDGHDGPNLLAWSPKNLLASVTALSDHPTPAPLEDITSNQPMQLTARPVEIASVVKLYGQCSSLLHVGRPDRIIQAQIPPYDLDKLGRAVRELQRLAWAHVLLLPGIQRVVIWHGKAQNALVGDSPGEGVFNDECLPSLDLTIYD